MYSIPISGTADCSILTLFPYFNDCENKFKFIPSHNVNIVCSLDSKVKTNQNYIINVESTDDRNPIDKVHNSYENMVPNQLDC